MAQKRTILNASLICLISFLMLCCSERKLHTLEDFSISYKTDAKILEELKRDSTPWKHQVSASEFALKSAFFNALEEWDLAIGAPLNSYTTTQKDSIVQNYTAKDAKDFILEQSENHDILILNEAHHISSHRMFARQLLEGLYRKGYRYLGMEALGNGEYIDNGLGARGYAVKSSGYYTADPQFGNMIREALALGFDVFPYEKTGQTSDSVSRDKLQALNIKKFMDKHHEGKLFIYCGFDHVLEGKHGTWGKTMAAWLSEMTGQDPLTINQVPYTERSKEEYNDPLLKLIDPESSVVLLDEAGEPVSYTRREAYADIVVIHPITEAIDGRPSWLFQAPNKANSIPVPKTGLKGSVLALAYISDEDVYSAIPYDIVEFDPSASHFVMALQPGNYKIVMYQQGVPSLMFDYVSA